MTDPTIEALARGLTKAQRKAIGHLNNAWLAGPDLPGSVIDQISRFREFGIVDREFGDMSGPRFGATQDSLTVNLSACWFFRLTPLGLAVRSHLLKGSNDAEG